MKNIERIKQLINNLMIENMVKLKSLVSREYSFEEMGEMVEDMNLRADLLGRIRMCKEILQRIEKW